MIKTVREHPSGDARFDLLDKNLRRLGYRGDALIEVLHGAQGIFGYLSEDVLLYIARQLKLPPSRVYGVATFYHLFSLEPRGEHSCTVCMGTACYVKRAPEILQGIGAAFDLKPGETTPDGRLTLSTARCLGSCGLAPVLVIDGEVLGRESPEVAVNRLHELFREERV